MTTAGWIFMLLSWGVIIGLFAFAMVRTLSRPKNDNPDADVKDPS